MKRRTKKVKIDDYARWAAGIARTVAGETGRARLAYLGLGLSSEAGEVVDHVKRLYRDGVLDRRGLAEELGDLAYYWACLCVASGEEVEDILQKSVSKIERRIADTQYQA